ncbi:hypothetical protein [Spirochaeta isovalerica]|uniref:DUF5723 domain-containing protein n=1 Tax=Spirochaeta isovalerica TaxID=150 RepID=A0A841REC6_9SPIO|nr:hypothetical protein [Spirochaeta isovalerica]MBB6480702.1 hypothetical protein [Spirochaeta isovalerica]
MKKIFAISVTALLFLIPAAAQAEFSGTAEIGFSANITDGDFDSLLNPGNMMEMKDLSMNTSLIARFDAGDEKTTFSAWFSLKEYPIGQALMASAYNSDTFPDPDSVTLAATGEVIALAGDTIFSLDIMRFSANVALGDSVSLIVGRQSMLTGYGYGWNPIDFANPLKDPSDPDTALRGVDALAFSADFGYIANLKVYGILPDDLLASGIDFEEIKGGGELTFYLPGFEVKLTGLYDYDAAEGSDAYVPSLGAGFLADLFGLGFYGEAAVRKGSRNNFVDGTDLSRKTEWIFSALAGVEYTFPSELYAVVEYFYNGEGYDNDERNEIEAAMALSPTTDLMSMYRSGYFARHYIMLSLMQPLYSINTDLNLTAIFSPDSGALMILPSVSYNFSGNFSGRIEYSGLFDLYNDGFSEVSALPVKHIISTVFTYSY